MTDRFQATRNIRGAFRIALFYLMVFVIAYSWYSWEEVKKAETNQLSLLAELESKFLDSYFAHLENSLRMLTEDLQSERLPIEGERAQKLLKRIKLANKDLANINVVRPNGQLVTSALNPAGSPLPSLANESSFIMGIDALQRGEDFNMGRPYVGKLVNEWIIPLRYAIRDGNGLLLFIIQATLPLSRQQNLWQSLYLPKDATLSLLRDDGYLLSRYPSPLATEMDTTYGNPQAGALMTFLKANRFPQQGVVEGLSTASVKDAVAFHRLSWYPLTLSVGTSLSYIRTQWWNSNKAFYLLTGIFLLSGVGIYMLMMRRQADWEAEREAGNQKIIEANLAKGQAEKHLLELELDDVKLALDDVKLALDHHSIVSIADMSGNITYANDKFCEISGYSREVLIGVNHRILNSGLHSREFFIEMWHVISSGKIWHGQIRNQAKDGTFYWVESTIVPFLNKDGIPYQYVSIRTDITAFIKARAAAEEANRAKSQFLSSMSHELRTPLNAILGFGQLLDMQIEPDKKDQHEFVTHILTAGNQLLGLINDLLDLSRIEIGKLEFNIQDVSIAEFVESSVSLVANGLANNRGIKIENSIVSTDLLVKGDGLRIRQVLINLLTNAVKYNRDNGFVNISSLTQPDGRLRIQVRDTGEGIASDKLKYLFQHFERIDQKHGKIEGAGIGLYVCKQLVEAMGGEIGAESVKGQGSTFWFALPMADVT